MAQSSGDQIGYKMATLVASLIITLRGSNTRYIHERRTKRLAFDSDVRYGENSRPQYRLFHMQHMMANHKLLIDTMSERIPERQRAKGGPI